MKHIVAISLGIVILMQPLSKAFIFISFKLNQEYIAANLCVNREVKNNTCKGNCQLKKRLADSEKNGQKQFPKNLIDKIEILFCASLPVYVQPVVIMQEPGNILNSYYSDHYTFLFCNIPFHPPQST